MGERVWGVERRRETEEGKEHRKLDIFYVILQRKVRIPKGPLPGTLGSNCWNPLCTATIVAHVGQTNSVEISD